MAWVKDGYKPLDAQRAEKVHGSVVHRGKNFIVRVKELPDGQMSVRVHSRYGDIEKLPIGYFLGVNYLYTGEYEAR